VKHLSLITHLRLHLTPTLLPTKRWTTVGDCSETRSIIAQYQHRDPHNIRSRRHCQRERTSFRRHTSTAERDQIINNIQA
jgi:hypothetical protein